MTQLAEKLENVVPGVYPGLSYAEYVERLPGVRISDLREMRRSPAHCREAMLHPKESTPDLALGHAFHVFALEPERFWTDYAIAPKVDRRTRLGKEAWADFERAHPRAILLEQSEVDRFEGMRAAIQAHETAREMLNGPGSNELSITWKDEPTGLPCKARLDSVRSYGGWTWIIDLKTCRDASEKAFPSDVGKYGYHRQGAWYRAGLDALHPLPRCFCLIAVEKDPPYAVGCHQIEARALEQGEREFRAYLALYKRCVETGQWPAYGSGLSLIDLKPWDVDRIE